MKVFIFLFSLLQSVSAVAAERNEVKFDFRSVSVAQIVQLIYSESLKGAYVIDPDVLSDSRTVSFRYSAENGDIRSFMSAFTGALGISITRIGNVDFISKVKSEDEKESKSIFVYRPKYRDGSYLADVVSPLLKGTFTANKLVHAPVGSKSPQESAPVGSAAANIDRDADVLVFSGSASDVDVLQKLLPQIDQPVGEVMVRAVLFEVSSTKKDGSDFSAVLSLLSGKLAIEMPAVTGTQSFLRVKGKSIEAIFSSLVSDNRFKVISQPSLRVKSGSSGRFTVGQDVPILGSLSYPGNGQTPVQSVEYRSSGVIFDLAPKVYDSSIDLSVMQQVSSFVATDTGVNGSPTLTKRELKTELSLVDGEVVLLGGLSENKESNGSSGPFFLPKMLRANSDEKSDSQILLLLQVNRL